ncbi:MAG: energy transducer TonB, partial [Bacteroidales bacterium]|nr:energy transducer TonB [Bacteroidales bacterium]
CQGTCPSCEAEVQYLEQTLAERLRLGKVATVAGLGLSLTACGHGGPLVSADRPDEGKVGGIYEISSLSNLEEYLPPDVTAAYDTVTATEGVMSRTEPFVDTDDMKIIEEGEIDYEGVYIMAEVDPSFPGGVEAMLNWIETHLQYPEIAKENGIEGTVYVTFIVEPDGTLSNSRVLRDIGSGCGKEALRLVHAMPKWNPGRQNGDAVRVQFNLPVAFRMK